MRQIAKRGHGLRGEEEEKVDKAWVRCRGRVRGGRGAAGGQGGARKMSPTRRETKRKNTNG